MSSESDAIAVKPSLSVRILRGLICLLFGYVLFFVFLLLDVYAFEEALFFNPIRILFPSCDETIGAVLETIYFPLLEPLEALQLI